MAFKFESEEFKTKFDKVESIARNVIENEASEESIKKLANYFLTATHVFNTNLDLSDYDKCIEYSRKQPVSDFVKVVDQALNKYKDSNLEADLIYIFDITLNLINIYFSELTFILGGVNNSIALEVGSFIEFVSNQYANDPNFRRYIRFAERDLPFQIFKEIFHSNEIKNLAELNSKLTDANNLITNWDDSIQVKQEEIKGLEQRLKDTKLTYDFIGLNKGFQQLYDQKQDELKKAKETYAFVSAVMFMIPFVELIILIGSFLYFKGNIPTNIWLVSIPFITLILITLYLVKISLQDKRSVQSQMMQLELRMALCQFIHNYAEDSENLHKKNTAGFEKFENIIFSPLVSSDDKIPTTFDGIEQLANLVSQFKNK